MIAADILSVVVRVNLAAGAAILGVTVMRRFVRTWFGARVAYGLWLLPVLASAAVIAPARQVVVMQNAAPALATVAPVPLALPIFHPTIPIVPQATASLDPVALLLGIWLAGVLVAVLLMALLQRRFARAAIKGAVGPAVVGLIAPRIVTPKDFEQLYNREEQALVLAHERAHIARQDSRLNSLSAAAQCLCWFNPLVHLGAHLMRMDQELACDETVVARFPDGRRAYAEVLVKSQLAVLLLPLGCYWPSKGKHPLVERVAMLKLKDFSRTRRLTGAAALAVLCTGAVITAWAAQPANVRIVVRQVQDRDPQAPNAPIVSAPVAKLPASSLMVAQIPNQAAPAPTATANNVPAAQIQTLLAQTSDDITRLRAEQEAPQQLVPFDPTHFDKYVGFYQLGPNVVFKITRNGGKLLTQLTGQGPVQVYPESETKFFATVVAAQVSFETNARGDVTELILHQAGREQHAKKIDEAAAKNAEAALAERIKSNTPSPGTEAFLRRYIASQEAGRPDYSEMTPGLELAARAQQERLTKDIAKWGQLVSVEFTRVNPGGADLYMLTFKNEKVPTTVAPVGPDGRVGGLLFQPQ